MSARCHATHAETEPSPAPPRRSRLGTRPGVVAVLALAGCGSAPVPAPAWPIPSPLPPPVPPQPSDAACPLSVRALADPALALAKREPATDTPSTWLATLRRAALAVGACPAAEPLARTLDATIAGV